MCTHNNQHNEASKRNFQKTPSPDTICCIYILYLQSHAFALVVLWLSSPPQEGTHILSNLAHGGRGSYGNRNKSTVSTMF